MLHCAPRLKQEVLLDCARAARYSKEYQAAHRFLALGINLGKPCNEYRAQIYILSVDPLNLSVLKVSLESSAFSHAVIVICTRVTQARSRLFWQLPVNWR